MNHLSALLKPFCTQIPVRNYLHPFLDQPKTCIWTKTHQGSIPQAITFDMCIYFVRLITGADLSACAQMFFKRLRRRSPFSSASIQLGKFGNSSLINRSDTAIEQGMQRPVSMFESRTSADLHTKPTVFFQLQERLVVDTRSISRVKTARSGNLSLVPTANSPAQMFRVRRNSLTDQCGKRCSNFQERTVPPWSLTH